MSGNIRVVQGLVSLLATLVLGCATTHVVYFETGIGKPIVYTPSKESKAVEVKQSEILSTVMDLLLDMPLSLRPDQIRSARRENESAQTLAENGYHVEQNP